MADISKHARMGIPHAPEEDELIAFSELLYFAYRDFTGDADAILMHLGFGRAHHRVLHFVRHRPGLRVAALLDILNITKQSLARVLRQLIDEGYIEQRPGSDRRERLLFVTEKGEQLTACLAAPQMERLVRALASTGPDERAAIVRFLSQMASGDNGELTAAAE